MNSNEKEDFINFLSCKEFEKSKFDWDELCSKYNLKPQEIFSKKNSKYTVIDENGNETCSVYTISNGNAFSCPSLKRKACTVPCYGLKGCYTWNSSIRNNTFQRLILKFAPINWIFEGVKHLATSKQMKEGNKLRELRLNAVSDLTQEMADKMLILAKMIEKDADLQEVIIFTYTKNASEIDAETWKKIENQSNFTVNASQTVNPIYKGGNCYIAVTEDFFETIEETETVKKCNCEINCKDCRYCYSDNDYIIFCKLH